MLFYENVYERSFIMENEKELNNEIKSLLGCMEGGDVTSDEYKAELHAVTILIDKAIEIEKLNRDSEEKSRARLIEQETKEAQMNEERKHRWIGYAISIAGLVIPSAITIWGTIKSFQFEETGTITTSVGKSFTNRLFRKN